MKIIPKSREWPVHYSGGLHDACPGESDLHKVSFHSKAVYFDLPDTSGSSSENEISWWPSHKLD